MRLFDALIGRHVQAVVLIRRLFHLAQESLVLGDHGVGISYVGRQGVGAAAAGASLETPVPRHPDLVHGLPVQLEGPEASGNDGPSSERASNRFDQDPVAGFDSLLISQLVAQLDEDTGHDSDFAS